MSSKKGAEKPGAQPQAEAPSTADGRPVVLQTVDLAKRYKRGRISVAALDGISITVGRGEIIGIIGPSGSGKTTLLNMIGGSTGPHTGR